MTTKQGIISNNTNHDSNRIEPATTTAIPCISSSSKKKPDSGLPLLHPPGLRGSSKEVKTKGPDDKPNLSRSDKVKQHHTVLIDISATPRKPCRSNTTTNDPNLKSAVTSSGAVTENHHCSKMKLLKLVACIIIALGIAIAIIVLTVLKDGSDDSTNKKFTFKFDTGTLMFAESNGAFVIQLGNDTHVNVCSTVIQTTPKCGSSKSYTLNCPMGTQASPMNLTALTRDAWYIENVSIQEDNAGSFVPMEPEGIWCHQKPFIYGFYGGRSYQDVIPFTEIFTEYITSV